MQNVRSFRPYLHILLVLSILVLTLGTTVTVFAQAPTFGIHPEDASIGYYQFTLAPGESIQDALVATNPNQAPISLRIAMVRGSTMAAGGISFAENTSGAAQWVEFPDAGIVDIPPNSAKVLPFQVAIPADALPGEYVVGFLAMLQDSNQSPVVESGTGNNQSSLTVQVVSQVAISMIITVTGDSTCSAAVTSLTSTSREDRWILGIGLQNTGTVHFSATGEVIARSAAGGDPVAGSSFTVGYFIPGDAIDFPLSLDPYPTAGDYMVEVILVTNCGSRTSFSQPLTISSETMQQAASGVLTNQSAIPSDDAARIPAQAKLIRSGAISLGLLAALLLVIGAVLKRRQRE